MNFDSVRSVRELAYSGCTGRIHPRIITLVSRSVLSVGSSLTTLGCSLVLSMRSSLGLVTHYTCL